jgi:glycosyltransferase involved in cell wall biosynthesis
MSQAAPTISLVTPAFNEAGNLAALHRRLTDVMKGTGLAWEWIVVDDHSVDATFAVITDIAVRDTRTTGLRLARNSGSHAAILCGLDASRGEAAIVLAADGQDPPEEIPRIIAAWRAGAAVVWAEKRVPGAPSRTGRLASRAFNGLLQRLSGLETLARSGSDYFLVARPVIQVINALGERNTNVMALLAWIGFDQVAIGYDKEARATGQSGWTAAKKLKLFLDSVIGFTVRPLQAISVLGFVIALLGFAYAVMVIANAIFGRPVEGWSSLMVVVLIIGGVQMVMLGILGEYLWRALDESRGRPRYIVERRTDRV